MGRLYTTFEELDLYKVARSFRREMYRLAKTFPEEERYGLVPQVRRASVSLTNNIAEGHGRFHYQENIHFLRQARGSLQELIDDLNVCLDERYGDPESVTTLKQQGYQLLKQLNAYIKYLRTCKANEEHSPTQLPITNYQLPVSTRGFTLVEIMLVVIIIGVLAATVVPRFAGRTEQAKVARAKADVAAIELGLDLYELDVGQYPSSFGQLTAKERPSSLGQDIQWNGPYLKKGLPKDPWGRDYQYTRDSQHGQEYDLSSLGRDGQPGHDDIGNW